MKTKNFMKKLRLNKKTIANLNGYAMNKLKGGAEETPGTNGETCTRDTLDCCVTNDTWGCCETNDTCTCPPVTGKGCPTYTCQTECGPMCP